MEGFKPHDPSGHFNEGGVFVEGQKNPETF
jgi:hypothetical protein